MCGWKVNAGNSRNSHPQKLALYHGNFWRDEVMTKTGNTLVHGPRSQAGDLGVHPGVAAHSELNDIVLQGILNLTSSFHNGARIDCVLSDGNLYVRADRQSLSKIISCVLEFTIQALNLLPHDPTQSYSGVLRTWADKENNVALEIFHVSILKREVQGEVITAGVIVANLILQRGQERAQTLLKRVGGRIDVDVSQGSRVFDLKIRMDMPRLAHAEELVNI